MGNTQVDYSQFYQMLAQFQSYNAAQQPQFGQLFGALNPEFLSTQSSQQINNYQQNQAYLSEILQQEINSVIRTALMGATVAPYASIKDPAEIMAGSGVQLAQSSGEKIQYTDTNGALVSADPQKLFNLELFQLQISGDNPKTKTTEPRRLAFINRVTGNGIIIEKGLVKTVVNGKVTATAKLADLAKGQDTLTLMLETGVKINLKLNTKGKDPVLESLFMSSPDGSCAEVKGLNDPKKALDVNSGVYLPEIVEMMDQARPDGTTLFMGPEGCSLHNYNQATKQFEGVFGDPKALSLGLSSASFGGNFINFWCNSSDQNWYASAVMSKYLPVGSDGQPIFPWMPNFPGFPPGMEIPPGAWGSPGVPDCLPAGDNPWGIPGFPGLPPEWYQGEVPPDCNIPPGFYPPPGCWGKPLPNGATAEDLIFENLTGCEKNGGLDKLKKCFLQGQFKYGKLDLETKLMIVLYLFIEENDQKTTDILEKLAGVDNWDMNKNKDQKPQGYWNETNIDQADIKTQMDFWSNYQPPDLSTDSKKRQEQLQANATKVQGKMQGTQIDQSLLTTQLTNLVRDRQRFVEEIGNMLKAMDDALASIVRRIV